MCAVSAPERPKPHIALIVLTRDAAATLPRCIASAQGLVTSVLVVDSFSTDDTPRVARQHGAVVLQRPFINYGDQRNWASARTAPGTEWILHLDADEYLTPQLASEIAARLSRDPGDTAGFLMRRRMVFLGREMRYGGMGGTWHLRLYRVNRGRCEGRRYDQHFIADGPVQRLRGFFIDDDRASLEDWVSRHNRWSSAEAEEILDPSPGAGRVEPRLAGSPIHRKRWLKDRVWGRLPLLWRPFAYFLYRYFLRLGFLDGREGLIFHVLQGFWFRFLVDSKAYERSRSV